jgi:signal transduction histidine kinase
MEPQASSSATSGRPRVRLPAGFAVRLAFATSVLVVGVCMAQSWLLARHDVDHVREYLSDRGTTLVGQLAHEAERTLADGDVEAVERLVDQTRAASGVVYARVLDRQGLLLAAAGQPPARGASDVWEFRALIGAGAGRPPAAVVGTAVVGLSLEPLEAMRRGRLTSAVVFAVLSALLGVLGAGLLARALTRPLTGLVEAADRISRGDFAARVRVDRHDEVGRLAGSFNAMAESLERSRTVLEEKVRELERADHLKSEFLATVSHELRTPLNVILGFTEMLAGGGGGDVTPAQAEMLTTIERYSRNQLELITSVLDFTRLSSGKVSVNVERFPLVPLLTDIEMHQSVRLRGAGVGLSVTVEPEVDEVETDRVKLQEIVRNLVDNAVKFTEAGMITVRAYLASPGWLAVEVTDSGPGIPAEELDGIFEAFRQLGSSSTRSTGGVGLGLSIVRQLSEALGGSVTVTSTIGEGSMFRVAIPCVPAIAAEAGATAALDATARNATTLRAQPLRLVAGGASRESKKA